ncbi:hypothetical protein E4U13_003332 [Claviceps humidiphila]|uniref:Uncharacterized protein n=2 Tax=Claviceps TaxID=5110 RepID=A0A9P7TXM0_9HYPO|nr:hypothetical protein E4U13_003332 [Claviceps humidiphila]
MTTVGEDHLSIRFKHGVHTFFLFVEASKPMSKVTEELIGILKARYPRGLTTSIAPPKTTPLPSEPILVYGKLKVPNNPSRGWERVETGKNDAYSAAKCGFKNNSSVAFAFVADPSDDAEFEVEWPKYDDDLYEEQQ